MIHNILQGAATLSLAILVTDAVKETAIGGPHAARKWMAVIVVLLMILVLLYWIKPSFLDWHTDLNAKNVAVA